MNLNCTEAALRELLSGYVIHPLSSGFTLSAVDSPSQQWIHPLSSGFTLSAVDSSTQLRGGAYSVLTQLRTNKGVLGEYF
jgi:hypothetical protein